ncbi:MAG: hypothetical protein ABFC84_03090 [Veillonellales bacterium]
MQKWHVAWNLRGKKYYAYLRNSQKIEGKVKTNNVYLGADLVSAAARLQQYLTNNDIPEQDYLLQLHKLGIEKGVPQSSQDDRFLKRQKTGCYFDEILDMVGQITNSTTFEERQNLQKRLYTAIIGLRTIVLPETVETTAATPNTEEETKIRADFEYDKKKSQWTEDSIKKQFKSLEN